MARHHARHEGAGFHRGHIVRRLFVRAQAFDIADGLTLGGYADLRVIAPSDQLSWVKGGLGKLRYGEGDGNARFAAGVLQAEAALGDNLDGVALLRAEPQTRGGVDVLETYLRYVPAASGDVSWSVKAGAFCPVISLENDDIGWTSPYRQRVLGAVRLATPDGRGDRHAFAARRICACRPTAGSRRYPVPIQCPLFLLIVPLALYEFYHTMEQ